MAAQAGSVDVAIIGAGFTGLAAAHALAMRGFSVAVFDSAPEVGGLASSFDVGGTRLEKFYHHWFRSDVDILGMITELGLENELLARSTNTGLYFSNKIYRLASPLDLLRFNALSLFDRVRLGLLALRVRRIKNWKLLEHRTAAEWLIDQAGQAVFDRVWGPLLKGKFGPYADCIGAVWIWNKLKLRGGSRSKKGSEELLYMQGGFSKFCAAWKDRLEQMGVRFYLGQPVSRLVRSERAICGVATDALMLSARAVLATPALPIIAGLVEDHDASVAEALRRIEYLGNVCLVLELDRSLSSTYWLNVNDPDFPFVGIIEHTNFETAATYGGRHVVYLSRYLPVSDQLFNLSKDEMLAFALPHLKRMFPHFSETWVKEAHLWREHFSQPVVTTHYSALIPDFQCSVQGLFIATMAQIYPEDRGTNYAVRSGRVAGERLAAVLGGSSQ